MRKRVTQTASIRQAATAPFTGTWNATAAATRPTTRNMPCRIRKYQARLPVCADASDIAIDAE